jgi:hypothetical protein
MAQAGRDVKAEAAINLIMALQAPPECGKNHFDHIASQKLI